MEKLNIKKTGKSQYGYYLLIDDGTDNGFFRGTTEQVSKFLSNRVPCKVEVEEVGEKDQVKRVNILEETQEDKDKKTDTDKSIESKSVRNSGSERVASMILSYMKDLVVAGKVEYDQMRKEALGMMNLWNELADK